MLLKPLLRQVDLAAYRHAAWGGQHGDEEVVFLGKNMTDAAFLWCFAQQPGREQLFVLEGATPGMQGLSCSYDEGYVHAQTAGTAPYSVDLDPILVVAAKSRNAAVDVTYYNPSANPITVPAGTQYVATRLMS